MRHRARCVIAALAAATAATALAGCGGGSASGPKELHILVGNISQYPQQQAAWLDKLKQQFKAKTGADIVFEKYASSDEEQTKIQTSMVSGNGPDIYQLGTTFVPVAYATKGFHQLSDADWQKLGGRQRFLPESLSVSGPDPQHQIGVPMSMRPYGMAYNTDMFKEAGITDPPKTWDEFVADAQKLQKPDQGVYGTSIAYADNYSPWKWVWMNTLQSGGRVISDDLKKAQLDSPEDVTATDNFFDLLTKDHIVDPKSVSWKDTQALAAFADGKAAMVPMVTPTTVPSLDKSSVKGKYAFAPMPLIPVGATTPPPNALPAGTIASGDDLAIASYSKNTDLALQYLEMVTSPEMQKEYSQTFGDVPANAQAAEELAAGDAQKQAFLQAEKTSLPTSFTGAWSDVQIGLQNAVKQTLPSLANGSYDPEAVKNLLTQANQKVQASLDHHRN